jgi:hypothetical protein
MMSRQSGGWKARGYKVGRAVLLCHPRSGRS